MKYTGVVALTLILLAAVLPSSCKTGGTVLLDSVSDRDRELLTAVEIDLLAMRLTPDESLAPRIGENLLILNAKETANREFLAWRACLNAEYLLLSGKAADHRKAEKWLDEAIKFNPDEQRIFIIKAMLTKDPEAKKVFLTEGSKLPWASRIYVDLGLLLYETGEHRQATTAFDSAFVKLPESYNVLYRDKRDISFTLRDTGLNNPASVTILVKEGLTLRDLIVLIWNETDLMDKMATDLKDKKLFSRLLSEGFLSDPTLDEGQAALRRETAFFITALVAYRSGQPDLMKKTADYYTSRGWKSPLPDMALDSPWFGAAVYCIEQQIMDLPDGARFFPDRPVTGAEMRETIKALKKLYPTPPKG
jgi:tetratricopeptide (TPR) repeat protein